MPLLGFLLCSAAMAGFFPAMAEAPAGEACPPECACTARRTHISCTNASLPGLPARLPGLTSQLRLRSQRLPEVAANAFLSLPALISLYLDGNDISSLAPGAFSGLGRLEYLHLNNNSIEELQVGVFENITSLGFLHLQNNLLTNIVPGVFTSLMKLNVLDLSNNRLSRVADVTFKSLPALRWLFLSNNQISGISSRAFAGNRDLRKLHLDNNRLTAVPLRALRALRKLEVLQISSNNISSLNSVIFKFLVELYMDDLFLDQDPSSAFTRFRKLEILSMRNNRLATLSDSKSFRTVKQFGLSGNAWRCDCQLLWLQAWLLKHGAADQREVTCRSPSPHSGKLLVNIQAEFLTCPPYGFEVTATPWQRDKNKTSTPRGLPSTQGTVQAFSPNAGSAQTTVRANTGEKALPVNPDPCLSNRIKEVRVSEVSTNTLLVNWDIQKDMGDDYEVRYTTAAQEQSLHMMGGVREVELSQLNAGARYQICVIPESNTIHLCHRPASNQCSEAHTTGSAEAVQSEDKKGQHAVVGGITLMVVLAIIGAVIAAFKLRPRRIVFQRHYDEDASTYVEHFEIDQSKMDFDQINSAFEDITDDSSGHVSHVVQSPTVVNVCTVDCYTAPEAEPGVSLTRTSFSNNIL
ncbi:uncharacterized protein LOC144611434 [Rhinoraja longicauda]